MANPQEKWLKVIGHEKQYLVSDLGRIKNIISGKQLKFWITHRGYYEVDLNRKRYKVHRVVALAFLPLREGKNLVNHIDFDRLNNTVSNLEWVNALENNRKRSPKKPTLCPHCGKVIPPKGNSTKYIK